MANYYVDAALGDDSNPGTQTQPWKTVSKVNSTSFNAGDNIYFKRGEIWRETLTIPSSGSDGSPITFGAYGSGDKPKISGADVITGWSGPDANGEYYKSGFTTTPNVVLRDSSRISKGTVGSLGADEWGYDSGTLYLGFDPSSYTIEAGQRTSPITINGKTYITIENITVYGGNDRADIDAAGGNICIYGTSNNITLNYITSYGCHYSGIGVGGSDVSDVTISDVTVYDTLGTGIRFASGVTDSTLSNFTVHDCAMLPSDDGAGGDGGGVEVTSDCDNISISSGEIYNTGAGLTSSQKPDPGIAVYESTNVDITKVKIHDCYGGGAYYRSVTAGKLCSGDFTYNIVYDNGDTGVTTDTILTGLRLGGVDTGGVTVNVYNNVFVNNKCEVVGGTGEMGMLYVGPYTTVNFKNNILKDPVGDYSYYVLTSAISVTYTASNNCYHTTGGNNRWSWEYSDKNSLSEWESTSGETNSLNQDPLFVDADYYDFHLQPTSPCIDAGVNVGLTEDYESNSVPWGEGVDIGAYERTAGRMKDYLDFSIPDYNYYLPVEPQETMVERGEPWQEVLLGSGFDEKRIDLGDVKFYVTLKWPTLMKSESNDLFSFYLAVLKSKTFRWQNPKDGYDYVVRFDTEMKRAMAAGGLYSIDPVRLKVLKAIVSKGFGHGKFGGKFGQG